MLAADNSIRGKVAGILNSRELVLNRGAAHGVKTGMEFNVLSPSGSEIMDPDSGDVIGTVQRTKIRVKVRAVQECIAVASTYEMRRVNVGGTGLMPTGYGGMFVPPKWVTQIETIETDEDLLDKMTEEERHVKVGDPIVQVLSYDE